MFLLISFDACILHTKNPIDTIRLRFEFVGRSNDSDRPIISRHLSVWMRFSWLPANILVSANNLKSNLVSSASHLINFTTHRCAKWHLPRNASHYVPALAPLRAIFFLLNWCIVSVCFNTSMHCVENHFLKWIFDRCSPFTFSLFTDTFWVSGIILSWCIVGFFSLALWNKPPFKLLSYFYSISVTSAQYITSFHDSVCQAKKPDSKRCVSPFNVACNVR